MNKINWPKIKSGFIWFLKSYLWVIILLIGIDALTKWMFEIFLPNGRVTVIPNFFYFELLHNKGAGWGAFSGQKALLVTISVVAGAVMILVLAWKYKKLNNWYKTALYLMIAGDIGNLIDRAFYPNGVIDFIKFQFGSYTFPTFNLADAYLVIGVIILLIAVLFEDVIDRKKKEKAKANNIASSTDVTNDNQNENLSTQDNQLNEENKENKNIENNIEDKGNTSNE